MATIRLAAPDLLPDQVTNILNRLPQVAAKAGDRLYPGSKSKAVAKTGTWFLSTEQLPSSSPELHLESLVTLVTANLPRLRQIMPDLQVTFTLLIYGQSTSLPPELIQRIESIGTLERDVQAELVA